MPIFAFYVAPGRWQDRLIRWATRSPYSHVEYVLDDHLDASNACVSASKRDGSRVRQRQITWKPGHWRFVLTHGDSDDIRDRLLAEDGKNYDTLGAVLSITPFARARRGRWWCSQLMAHGLRLPDAERATPAALWTALNARGATDIGV